MQTVEETQDVLALLADVIKGIIKAKADDRKVSMPEALGLITLNLSGLIAAVSGIGKIPTEAKFYSAEEMDYLRDFFLTRVGWEPTDNNRDLAAAYFRLVRNAWVDGMVLYHTYYPPRAEPV